MAPRCCVCCCAASWLTPRRLCGPSVCCRRSCRTAWGRASNPNPDPNPKPYLLQPELPHGARHHFALSAETRGTRQPQERPRRAETRAHAGVGLGAGPSVGPDTGAAAAPDTGGAVESSFVSFEAAVQLECPPLTAAAPVRLRVVRRVVLGLGLVTPKPKPSCAVFVLSAYLRQFVRGAREFVRGPSMKDEA